MKTSFYMKVLTTNSRIIEYNIFKECELKIVVSFKGNFMSYKTMVGSMDSYDKGSIVLNDDLKHYAFSNIFEICKDSSPYERIMVVSNLEYCAEVARAEGASPWYTAPHDEFAIVMEGEVEFEFYQLEEGESPGNELGAARLAADPTGKRMGKVTARRGHEVLLPQGAAYQLNSANPGVVLFQTSAGPESVEKWSKICVLK